VNRIVPASFKPFEEVRDDIRQAILQQKGVKAFDKMAVKLEKNARTEVFEDRLR
jgi:hypothetical protein